MEPKPSASASQGDLIQVELISIILMRHRLLKPLG